MSVGSLRHAVTKSLHSDHSTFSLQPPPLACACEKALAVLFVSKAQLVLPLIFLFVLLFLVSGWLGPRSSLVPVRRMHRSAVVFTPLVLRHIVDLSGFSLRPARVLSSPRQRARIISQAFPRQTRLFVTEVFETFVACLFHFYLCTKHVREFPSSLFLAHSARFWYEFVGAVHGRLGVGLDAITCGRPHLLRSFTCCSPHPTPSPRLFLPYCLVRAQHFSEKKPAIFTQGGGFSLHITFSPSMYRLRSTCVRVRVCQRSCGLPFSYASDIYDGLERFQCFVSPFVSDMFFVCLGGCVPLRQTSLVLVPV